MNRTRWTLPLLALTLAPALAQEVHDDKRRDQRQAGGGARGGEQSRDGGIRAGLECRCPRKPLLRPRPQLECDGLEQLRPRPHQQLHRIGIDGDGLPVQGLRRLQPRPGALGRLRRDDELQRGPGLQRHGEGVRHRRLDRGLGGPRLRNRLGGGVRCEVGLRHRAGREDLRQPLLRHRDELRGRGCLRPRSTSRPLSPSGTGPRRWGTSPTRSVTSRSRAGWPASPSGRTPRPRATTPRR